MKKLMISIFTIMMVVSCTGCSSLLIATTNNSYQCAESKPTNKTTITQQVGANSYEYSGNVQFILTSYQHIEDGSYNGLDIMTYVDLNTGVMYVCTEKYAYGYGTTWEVLVNADGSPVIYEDLEALREKCNWGK